MNIESGCHIDLYIVRDNAVFLMVVNMDSECARHLACLLIILKLKVKISGKASVLIPALTGCWTRKLPILYFLSFKDWGKEENEGPPCLSLFVLLSHVSINWVANE